MVKYGFFSLREGMFSKILNRVVIRLEVISVNMKGILVFNSKMVV